MRDPTANARVEAAIASAAKYFSVLKRSGMFSKKYPAPDDLSWEACERLRALPDAVMPKHLRDYAYKVLHERWLKSRHTNAIRDGEIAETIWYIVKERGFPATRNNASRDKQTNESACSIVAKALARIGVNISERTVEDIWRKSECAQWVRENPPR